MSYNNYMYGIERDPEYLAHYGVKGMRWGVRKALASGSSRALDRQYRKASKKLAKLQRQAANGSKYAKRAAALGAGAAAAGGLAVAGTSGVSKAVRWGGHTVGNASVGIGGALSRGGENLRDAARGIGNQRIRQAAFNASANMRHAGNAMQKANMPGGIAAQGNKAANAISRWGKSNSISSSIADNKTVSNAINKATGGVTKKGNQIFSNSAGMEKATNIKNGMKGVSNNTIARVGAGAVGAGLLAGAGYNAYRAATTKKAAQKAANFQKEMNQAFKGTKYANQAGRSSSGSSSGNSNRSRKRRRNR